jgi:hypothetical protein
MAPVPLQPVELLLGRSFVPLLAVEKEAANSNRFLYISSISDRPQKLALKFFNAAGQGINLPPKACSISVSEEGVVELPPFDSLLCEIGNEKEGIESAGAIDIQGAGYLAELVTVIREPKTGQARLIAEPALSDQQSKTALTFRLSSLRKRPHQLQMYNPEDIPRTGQVIQVDARGSKVTTNFKIAAHASLSYVTAPGVVAIKIPHGLPAVVTPKSSQFERVPAHQAHSKQRALAATAKVFRVRSSLRQKYLNRGRTRQSLATFDFSANQSGPLAIVICCG